MITVYNIRGTNGSGKTTLARAWWQPQPGGSIMMQGPVDLLRYPSPTKADPDRQAVVEGYGVSTEALSTILVGSYRTACGGLDAVPNFDKTFAAVRSAIRMADRYAPPASQRAVIAEGILASTVWGSWGQFARELREPPQEDVVPKARVAFCYLDTPVEVCLERIRKRQEAAGRVREIKEDLVRDKVRAIQATRAKALAAGELVYDLPWEDAETALRAIMEDGWVKGRGSVMPGSSVLARDEYLA